MQQGSTLVHGDLAAVNAFLVRDDLAGGLGEVRVLRRAPNYWMTSRGHRHVDGGHFVEV